MKHERVKGTVLSARIIPQVQKELAESLKLRDDQKSLLVFTSDADDIAYISIDEATKMSDVEVVYGESTWAGSANMNTDLAGDAILMLAGPDPAEVKTALETIEGVHNGDDVHFIDVSDHEDGCLIYLTYCIARTGSYLSKLYGIEEGEPMAYCVAPPMENVYAADLAGKAANVRLIDLEVGPSPTNFGAAFFTGSQSACQAACNAYAQAVEEVSACHVQGVDYA